MRKESRKDIATQYAVAGAIGGVGRMVDKATSRGVSRAAERAAGIYKRRRRRKKTVDIPEPEKKLTGPMFFIMVGLAMTKDILDVIFTFTIFLSVLSSLFGIMISFLILFYFIYSDVKWTTRKLVTVILTFVIEFIPIISAFIPAATLNLFIVRKFENSDRLKKFAEKKATMLAKV
jgi:uncharacterized membrane protein